MEAVIEQASFVLSYCLQRTRSEIAPSPSWLILGAWFLFIGRPLFLFVSALAQVDDPNRSDDTCRESDDAGNAESDGIALRQILEKISQGPKNPHGKHLSNC
jgi:hypothetical protein